MVQTTCRREGEGIGTSFSSVGVLIVTLLPAWSVRANDVHVLEAIPIRQVQVTDEFWAPKLKLWSEKTVRDVLDKFERTGAFRNFDRVAGVEKGRHEGPPWYDGLVYETIRGASDFLISHPDQDLQARLDGYIQRIAAAQQRSSDGYLLTYTQLDEPGHRWGLNGGYQRWQHELYDAGALVEAGVHHYQATGKTQLLEVAVRFANHVCDLIGPAPKMSVVPSHSLPEEAFVELYVLFREDASLKKALPVPVDEIRYLNLAEYWLESRGHHCGMPTSEQWAEAEPECQAWIREQQYLGKGRPSWGDYAQDHKPVFEQETLEGHAVRATLLCTGLSAAARVNGREAYAQAARRLWDNMAGRRMHVTGGVGAFWKDEKFAPDYVLPNDAYLETCAAVGAGFFHRNMNLLSGRASCVDELERVLYNHVLNSVSLAGDRYTYQNPLNHAGAPRWEWHGCPCCPPMFLKIASALPGYIYARDNEGVYVNLFVGSKVQLDWSGTKIALTQTTAYPWEGRVTVAVDPEGPATFTAFVRVPGWAQGQENPFGLYHSDLSSAPVAVKVNDQSLDELKLVRGYAAIRRLWKKGDTITLDLSMSVRRVRAHPKVQADLGRVVLLSGPLVYCLEEIDNPRQASYYLRPDSELSLVHKPGLLGGINVVEGQASSRQAEAGPRPVRLTAIPFYCQGNRAPRSRVDTWIAENEDLAVCLGMTSDFTATCSHCFDRDTVGALNDGIEPSNSNDHSIPRHTWWDHKGGAEWVQYDFGMPRRVSSSAVCWWDDRPAGGQCAAPRSWRLLYWENDRWVEVRGGAPGGVEQDRFNEIHFDAVETTALRIEAQLQEGYSAGVLEWKVQ